MKPSTEDKENQARNNKPTRIVVLGSGYAGIHACRTLVKESHSDDNIEIVLISDTDHLLYVTMLYEIAAGNLAPSSIRQSVRTMISNNKIHFEQGRVDAVDADKQTVMYHPPADHTPDGDSARGLSLSYDYLISAIGSETNFFGTPGAKDHAYSLKTLQDGKQIKNALINNFEQADLLTDEDKQRELLSVVVVGGGPTGVTLAAKIADLFNNELAKAFPHLSSLAQVTIVEAQDKLVKSAGDWFSDRVEKALDEKESVQVVKGCYVNEVRPNGAACDGGFIPSQCVIWAAGVKAREYDITAQKGIELDKNSRRVHVTKKLQIPNYKNVFVAGDQAWVLKDEEEGTPYPARAQFAVREGKQAAENILHAIRSESLEHFAWEDKGIVISVGHGRTYAQVAGFHVSGFLATLAYKSIYLMSTVGVRAKLRAILEWGMNLFLPRDVSEL